MWRFGTPLCLQKEDIKVLWWRRLLCSEMSKVQMTSSHLGGGTAKIGSWEGGGDYLPPDRDVGGIGIRRKIIPSP